MAAEEVDAQRVEVAKVSDLGRYRLIAELARGGMGIVYLALVRGPGGFNKLFVVKELKSHLVEDPHLVEMFLEEARLAAKLNHPNVVQTIEIGSEGDRHFIAMEHLDGQALNRILTRSKKSERPLPMHYFLFVLVHMLEGLHYAHGVTDYDGTSLNLVHRDVSPHNVFVTYDGQVKILDFGIAKALDSSNDTRTGVLKGKVAYMAPEQAAGARPDRRADIFSAGVMLFEAAVGARMWSKAQNDLQILHSLMNGSVPKPREVKPDLDPALERIILKATAPKKEERYAGAAEMQLDIEAYIRTLDSPPFGARDVGKFIADVFAPDRARIKSLIDEQLRLLRGFASGEHVAVDLALLTTGGGQAIGVTPSGLSSSSASRQRVRTPGTVESMRSPLELAATRSESGAALAAERADGASKKRTTLLALAGVAGVLVIGGAMLLRRGAPAPAAPAAAPTLAAPAAAAPATSVHANVTASPREARITVDDGAPHVGSLDVALPRDGTKHVIRIEAAHFDPKTLTFSADDDHTFDVSLEPSREAAGAAQASPAPAPHAAGRGAPRTAAAQPPPAGAAAPAPPAAAAPAPQPSSTGHKQQIDTSDPYAH